MCLLLTKSKPLAAVVQANMIDSQRADNASRETQDAHFTKVQGVALQQHIYAMGVLSFCPAYEYWPKSSI